MKEINKKLSDFSSSACFKLIIDSLKSGELLLLGKPAKKIEMNI